MIVLPTFYQTLLRRLRKMQELEVALARSRLADKAKDQFLATMSHEIRTPMNGVLGMAQALDDTELNAEQREHLAIITRSVESLLHIINDILDYSKITSSNLSLEQVPFDLHQVLEDVQSLLQSTAAAKGVALEFDYPGRRAAPLPGRPDADPPDRLQPGGQRHQVHRAGQRADHLPARRRRQGPPT